MKHVLVFIAAFTLQGVFRANANDSCLVLLNKQVIFRGVVDQENPIAAIKSKDLKTDDVITILYHSESENSGWMRTFYIQDSSQENLKTIQMGKQSGSVTIGAAALRAMKE